MSRFHADAPTASLLEMLHPSVLAKTPQGQLSTVHTSKDREGKTTLGEFLWYSWARDQSNRHRTLGLPRQGVLTLGVDCARRGHTKTSRARQQRLMT